MMSARTRNDRELAVHRRIWSINENVTGQLSLSGKGPKAAMQVSAGRITRAANFIAPALLAGLNESLVGHTGGGFIPCVCARFDANGMIVANAGHVAPYRNGAEVEMDSGLPLGVVASGVVHAETSLPFRPRDRVMLVSDGVVGAAKAKGGLFGLGRTRIFIVQGTQRETRIEKTE
jgi:sigma-B regulation protein RsbU (phosphoserine phosphatase)